MDAENWIRAHVEPVAPIELVHERPWATVLRVPLAGGAAWFKACAPVQAFEPRLTAALAHRWPACTPRVLAHDEEQAWLLLGDAGTPLLAMGDFLDAWLALLPLYAELQRGETAHVDEHLADGVPDHRLHTLPAAYEALVARDFPLEPEELARLRAFVPRYAELCAELAARGIPPSVQHDDLHAANVYARDGRLAVLDWGDSCISHPFVTLLVTFRFLEEDHGVPRSDPWHARLRDAYLEPWGRPAELAETFELAQRVGAFAHLLTWFRVLDAMTDAERARYGRHLPNVLRRAVAVTG